MGCTRRTIQQPQKFVLSKGVGHPRCVASLTAKVRFATPGHERRRMSQPFAVEWSGVTCLALPTGKNPQVASRVDWRANCPTPAPFLAQPGQI